MTKDKENIKFIWEGWRSPCPVNKIGKLFSITVEKKFVIDTIEKCLIEIERGFNLNFIDAKVNAIRVY
ncbi:hypothetical protein FIA58_002270 [Flavobacterium jejuense]|uniref:Uncharacterized protein n=1 Tax=Flavobacterium jejuense TaxID=1544455 RepID=A0ABX0IRH9_9FLAO|nr:hypothetical protein [Flavobacterium jejuense]NHN24489.1 hypothetical protein [Flavobacterium jejuense]